MGEVMDEIIEWASLRANAEGILGLEEAVQSTRMACDNYIMLLKSNGIPVQEAKRIRLQLAERLERMFNEASIPKKKV